MNRLPGLSAMLPYYLPTHHCRFAILATTQLLRTLLQLRMSPLSSLLLVCQCGVPQLRLCFSPLRQLLDAALDKGARGPAKGQGWAHDETARLGLFPQVSERGEKQAGRQAGRQAVKQAGRQSRKNLTRRSMKNQREPERSREKQNE